MPIHSSRQQALGERLVFGGVPGQAGTISAGDAAVVVKGAGVGFLAQQRVDGRRVPDVLALGAGDLGLDEADGDLPDRQPVVRVPAEGLAHDGGLLFADLDPSGLPGGRADLAVAVGDGAGDDLSLAGPPEFAAAVPVDDLGALELGHRCLDLREQPPLGVIGVASFQEDDPDTEAGEFFEHERLVDVVAGQAVGAQRDNRVDAACGRGVAYLVEPRPVEAGSGVAVVGT